MIDEEPLFGAVILWARNRCKTLGRKEEGQILRDIVGDALYQIRFPLMKEDIFAMDVATVGLLEEREALSVLLNFNSIDVVLPFPIDKRKQKSLSRCNRLKKSPSFFSTKNRNFSNGNYRLDKISIIVNKDILVAGARIFTGPTPDQTSLKLTLADEHNTKLADAVTKQLKGCTTLHNNRHGVDILYERPVLLLQGNTVEPR